MKIIHLRNKAIDYKLWDERIAQSCNQLTYVYTWYLDIVSPNWEALVTENYEFIMPLPVKSRYKIPYLVQPVLTQQLGIFSKNKITELIVKDFIREIPYFSYEMALNESNFFEKAIISPNYILNLERSIDEIVSFYSKNTLRNIEKALKLNLSISETIDIITYINFYFSVDKHFLSPKQPILEEILSNGINKGMVKILGVYSANSELIAALCLLESENRLTYLLPVSNLRGKESYAMFILINYIIQNYAGSPKILDFEGSRIEGVARLYKGFGAKNQPYYILKRFRPSFLVGKINPKQKIKKGDGEIRKQ